MKANPKGQSNISVGICIFSIRWAQSTLSSWFADIHVGTFEIFHVRSNIKRALYAMNVKIKTHFTSFPLFSIFRFTFIYNFGRRWSTFKWPTAQHKYSIRMDNTQLRCFFLFFSLDLQLPSWMTHIILVIGWVFELSNSDKNVKI